MPTRIKILGQWVKVVYVDLPIEPDTKESDRGNCKPDERLIQINKSDPKHIQRQTLFHEVIHCILYFTGQSAQLDEEKEEGLVLAIEHGLWDMLPELAKLRS